MKFFAASLAVLPMIGLAAGQPSRHKHHAGSKHDALFKSLKVRTPYHGHEDRGVTIKYVDENGNPIPDPSFVQGSHHGNLAGYPGLSRPEVEPPSPIIIATPTTLQTAAATPVWNGTAPGHGGGLVIIGGGGIGGNNCDGNCGSGSGSGNVAVSPGLGESSSHGVTYSVYRADESCKSQEQVNADFGQFANSYGTIRLYGVDCDQVSLVYNAVKSYSNKLFLGIYELEDIQGQVQTMRTAINGDWSRVVTVSVGNEHVNSGKASAGQVIAALGQAKSALRAAGYSGPVVIVDTFNAVLTNPELCTASDYCAVNMHPFFDPYTSPENAGKFITTQLQAVRSAVGSQKVVITETGWPWKGNANGVAVPGISQQAAALQSIKSAFRGSESDCFLFTAFNDVWKKPEAATFFAEQYWGMAGRYSSCDSGY